jgi:D-amino-acid oxidase
MRLPIKQEQTIDLSKVNLDQNGNILPGDDSIIRSTHVCLRPGHKNQFPQIYAEEKLGKIVSHNYSHGGEGWSILFSSVELSIENFLQKIKEKQENISPGEEITIIGMGVIGMTTALQLIDRGFTNLKVIAEKSEDITSFNAGGLVDLALDYKNNELEKMNGLFESNFLQYQKIIKGEKYLFLQSSFKNVEYYFDNFVNAGIGSLIKKGILPCEKVNLQLMNKDKIVNSLQVYNSKTVQVKPSIYMSKIKEYLKSKGVSFELKKISSLDEINCRYIFNNTGLGSFHLNNDKKVFPICGHVITLNHEKLSQLNYIMIFKNLTKLTGFKVDGAFYFMPKTSGFIGGTFIEDYDGSDHGYNQLMLKKVLERAMIIFHGYDKVKEQLKMLPKF